MRKFILLLLVVLPSISFADPVPCGYCSSPFLIAMKGYQSTLQNPGWDADGTDTVEVSVGSTTYLVKIGKSGERVVDTLGAESGVNLIGHASVRSGRSRTKLIGVIKVTLEVFLKDDLSPVRPKESFSASRLRAGMKDLQQALDTATDEVLSEVEAWILDSIGFLIDQQEGEATSIYLYGAAGRIPPFGGCGCRVYIGTV